MADLDDRRPASFHSFSEIKDKRRKNALITPDDMEQVASSPADYVAVRVYRSL